MWIFKCAGIGSPNPQGCSRVNRFMSTFKSTESKNKKLLVTRKLLLLCREENWRDLGRKFINFAPLFSKKGSEALDIYIFIIYLSLDR